MEESSYPPFLLFILLLTLGGSETLQWHTLTAIHLLFNNPPLLNISPNATNLCSIEPQPFLTTVCYQDNITQLHISGENSSLPSPLNFSAEHLFNSLELIPSLKVLSVVSMGLHCPLSSSIAKLTSLEILNLSSNGIEGSIPKEISALNNLQTLVLDNNNLTGRIPDFLLSLPLLAVLSMKDNSLTGTLPPSLSNAISLRILVLSMNNFSGEVPNLGQLSNLQVLELDYNHFGLDFPTLPHKLVILSLRANRFCSNLPSQLSSFYQLTNLDLSYNGFTGLFPPSLLSFPSIVYLDISSNRFKGAISGNTSCNPELTFVNLSSNMLTGELPRCLNRIVHSSMNCLSNGKGKQLPYSDCHNEALAAMILPNVRHRSRTSLAFITSGMTIVAIFMSGMFFLIWKKGFKNVFFVMKYTTRSTCISVPNVAGHVYESKKLTPLGLPPYRVFTIEEIKEATCDFSVSNLLEEGSCSKTFKGMLPEGAVVAVKTFRMRKRLNSHAYTPHFELLSKLRNSNLVSMLGHGFEYLHNTSCISKIFLVFEFVESTTLRDRVSSLEAPLEQRLSWMHRIVALIGDAKGLQFLHTRVGRGIFSNNLKITDVLVDLDLQVKISKYNLPLLEETSEKVDTMASPRNPEESTSPREKCKDTSDILDLGIIILETIVGKPIISTNDLHLAKYCLNLANDDTCRRDVIDPIIRTECSEESLKTMMEICSRCLDDEPNKRPSIEDVLWNLHFAAQVQDSWQKELQSTHVHVTNQEFGV